MMKMEIKIRCTCGSVLSFEDTPVNGQLEHPLACTNCRADCTQKANDFIHRKLAGENPDVNEGKTRPLWLRPFRSRQTESDTAEISRRPGKIPANIRSATEAGDEASFRRIAVAGSAALLVGILGAIGWLLVAKATGYQIGYVAWALGGAVGLTSRLLAPRGHALLGMVGATAAFLAIGGGQYLVTSWEIQQAVREYTPLAYEEIVAYARETAAAQNSEDLRERTAEFKLVQALAGKNETNAIAAYQDYQIAESGFALLGLINKEGQPKLTFDAKDAITDVEAVTVPEIAKFDAEVAPVMQKLAAGQPSQTDYQASLEARIAARVPASTIAAYSVNRYTILWLFLGVGTAYRLARNAGLQY